MIYILKRKVYSKWDETDRLKGMKDSDILAEQKKPGIDYATVATNAGIGAAAGAGAGSIIGGISGAFSNKGKFTTGLKRGAGKGALIGGLIAGGLSYAQGKKQANENQFYNDRLSYAKRQAARRERKDWKINMTQRDGYSY